MEPKYPDIVVPLSKADGDAYSILSLCHRATKAAGLSKQEFVAFKTEATSDDYDHLLQTVMRWFECE